MAFCTISPVDDAKNDERDYTSKPKELRPNNRRPDKHFTYQKATGDSPLKTAEPLASGVRVTEKKSAVKTTIEVVPPEAAQQFFKVEFGK